MLCCVVLLGLLNHDEISCDLHSLDWLVSTRFLLIALLSRLVTESLDWQVWRDWLTWHERLGLMSFCACAAFLVATSLEHGYVWEASVARWWNRFY